MKLEHEVVRITPAIARQMLKHNTDNRPLRRTAVENLKNAFARGEYVMSHQGIAFVGETLVDGQHRLMAISEMPEGFSVEMLVCRGLDPRAKDVMDIGVKRTAADILQEDRKLVECARFLAFINIGSRGAVTPIYVRPFVDRIAEPHAELMEFCQNTCKMWSAAPVRAAYVVIALAGGDTDYAKLVYRAMVVKDFSTMPRCAQSVFRSHISGKVRASNAIDAFVRSLRIFNPANADLTQVKVIDTSPVLEIVRGIMRREVLGSDTPLPLITKNHVPPKPIRTTRRGYDLANI